MAHGLYTCTLCGMSHQKIIVWCVGVKLIFGAELWNYSLVEDWAWISNTIPWPIVGSILGQRLRHWTNNGSIARVCWGCSQVTMVTRGSLHQFSWPCSAIYMIIGAMGIPVHVGLHSVVDKQTRVGCSFNYAAPFLSRFGLLLIWGRLYFVFNRS